MTSVAPWGIAVVLSLAVSVAAWRTGSLHATGMIASTAIGTLALRVQWGWGAFLIGWFVLASLLSRIGRARKAHRTDRIIAKGARRDLLQVLANGGVFAASALVALLLAPTDPAIHGILAIAAAGSLAAAGSDTWATETGTWLGGAPWSVRLRQRVPVGTSGAITAGGSLGGMVGAVVIATLSAATRMIPLSAIGAVALGGLCGAIADTLAGAWLQERRWCVSCGEWTERRVHTCGASTDVRGGVRGLDNDAVNFLCALVGAGTASVWATILA